MRLEDLRKKNNILEDVKKPRQRQYDLKHLKPWMYKTPEEIDAWMKKNRIEGFIDRMDLSVHPTKDLNFSWDTENLFIDYKGKKVLPVDFHHSTDVFNIPGIENFYGFPDIAFGDVCVNSAKLNSVDGFTGMSKMVQGRFTGSTKTTIHNFHGLGECHIKQMSFGGSVTQGVSFAIIETIKGLPTSLEELSLFNIGSISGLDKECPQLTTLYLAGQQGSGFLCILRMKNLKSFEGQHDNPNTDVVQASIITQKHFKEDKDILECQEELITNGLKRFATF